MLSRMARSQPPYHNTTGSLRVPKSRFYSTPDPTSLLELDLDLDLESPPVSPRYLYADSFDRGLGPSPSPRLGPLFKTQQRHRKTRNMSAEDDFDALPIAVRRKVCGHFPAKTHFKSNGMGSTCCLNTASQ